MKEIIEYLLAILIILSFIPLYNMLSTTYYTPRVEPGVETASYAFEEALKYVLLYGFSIGNYTQEVTEVSSILNSTLENYLGPYLLEKYGFYARVHTPIEEIRVIPYSTATILSVYNLTTYVLLINKSGREMEVVNATYVGQAETGKFTYVIYLYQANIKDPGCIIVVQESRNNRFIAYWMSPQVWVGQPLNINGLTVFAGDYTLNSTLIPGLGPAYNASIFYYSGPGFGQYLTSRYNITEWIVFDGGGNVLNRTYNITTISYLGLVNPWNQTHNVYRIVNFRLDQKRVWNRSGDFGIGNYSYVNNLTQPIYNLVLVSLFDTNRGILTPIYRNEWKFGESPPTNADTRYSSIRIGMFDYLIEIKVWRK
ncbi:MAG: hypothetical protein QW182_07320 [Thermosphaera sp.]